MIIIFEIYLLNHLLSGGSYDTKSVSSSHVKNGEKAVSFQTSAVSCLLCVVCCWLFVECGMSGMKYYNGFCQKLLVRDWGCTRESI